MEGREAEAAAAMGDLAAALRSGASMPVLAARAILESLDMPEDLMELDASVLEAVQRMEASAQGEAGDAKKSKAAAESMLEHGMLHEWFGQDCSLSSPHAQRSHTERLR